MKPQQTWNKIYQDLYDKAKKIIKKDTSMKFHYVSIPIYLETDASGVSLGAGLLQVMEGMNCGHDEVPHNATLHPTVFANKGLSNAEECYSNIELEAIGILHGLEKFHHYHFAKDVCLITDHKPLVAIISHDAAMLPQHLQHIML